MLGYVSLSFCIQNTHLIQQRGEAFELLADAVGHSPQARRWCRSGVQRAALAGGSGLQHASSYGAVVTRGFTVMVVMDIFVFCVETRCLLRNRV